MASSISAYSIETASGVYFDLNKPDVKDIRCMDIAIGLSTNPRFNGHARRDGLGYSVAQHSIDCFERMKRIRSASPNLVAWALLHDAHEAYIGDLSRPLEMLLGSKGLTMLKVLKGVIDREICKKFNIDPIVLDPDHSFHQQMKIIDEQALRDEAYTFMKSQGREWAWSSQFDGIAPSRVDPPMSPNEACNEFIDRLHEIKLMGFTFEMD